MTTMDKLLVHATIIGIEAVRCRYGEQQGDLKVLNGHVTGAQSLFLADLS